MSGVQSPLTENTGSRDKIGDDPEKLLKASLVLITAMGDPCNCSVRQLPVGTHLSNCCKSSD